MRGTGEKTKAISRHRLCLIVPLAIQLSFFAILLEVAIVQWIRDDVLTLHPYFGGPYFLLWLVSLPWLFIYAIVVRKELGKAATNWILVGPLIFLLFLFFGMLFPRL